MKQQLAEIGELVSKLVRMSNKSLLHHDCSKQQILLLRTMQEAGKTTVSELADQLALSVSATTLALNRLANAGYILRERDKQDRRLVWVELSKEGLALMNEWQARRMETISRLVGHLSSEEQTQFIGLLKKIITSEMR